MATNYELLKRIRDRSERCFGKPCIRGTRIWVSLVLDLLASGRSQQEILEDYPRLTALDIQACLAYGSGQSTATHRLPQAVTDKLGHDKLFVVVKAVEDVGDVVDGLEAAAEAKL
jgi:uncharacterized protein (DUF433 family)